ncbi:NAD-dependent epimerase/dehydratase family protein [Actinomadura gamaensis]|uniref:NAD-dependent epimerase/dehydratase family protein n=1 Tax=Actinomadura gamaensis TaxID=1763541 RepID=A0ABV9U0U3_9ACTN
MPKALITGAAGGVGRILRAGLPALGWELRGFDVAPGEGDWVVGDVRDPAALDTACAGVDAVVHLAARSIEAPFPDVLSVNMDGTYQVFEAARRAGVRRVVFASSNHAVGATPRSGLLPVDAVPRPDGYYGLSKVFGEGLCSLYADKEGMQVVAIRIGSCFERPTSVRMLATWLSPGDANRLFHAALTAPVHYEVVYGISANTRGWWDLEPARKLGYEPQDDAEVFAAEVIAEYGEFPPDHPENSRPGGAWTTDPLPR